MLLLGHAGITLLVTKTFESLAVNKGIRKIPELIDYRLVLVGSMLPDIIDKPLGHILFRETLGNGRLFAHTLLFLLALLSLGLYLQYRFKRPGMLVLTGGSLIHHILDSMWFYPGTFFWPAYGWKFPKGNLEGYFWQLIAKLTEPRFYLPEIIGGVILLSFLLALARKKKLRVFIKTGKTRIKQKGLSID